MLTRRSILLAAAATAIAPAVMAAPPVAQSNGYAIGGFDVVAYHRVKKAVRGKAEFSHRWNDATWLFESAEHRDMFAANPTGYAPQYGGHCAMNMVSGKQSNGSPQAWSIRNGKLYLNGNIDVNRRFEADGDTFISKADTQWQRWYANK